MHESGLRAPGEWDADGAWAIDGSLTPASWLTHRANVTTVEARDLVRSARLVQSNTTTAKALAAGDISSSHVSTAARAARHYEDLYAEHEDVIVDAARITNAEDFRAVAARWRSMTENVVEREPKGRRFDRRYLHISPVLEDMCRIDGLVPAETGTRFAQVLDALEPPDPTDGDEAPRPLAMRRADALDALTRDGRDAPTTTLHAVIDIDTLQGQLPSDLTSVRCDLLGGGPIDVDTAVRMACDAAISRVLVQGKSTVLDLGLATPVVSRAQRRALAIRDGGCVEPGCTAPPNWCDAHHKLHWILGGPTDLSNLELRCRRHHVAEHRRNPKGVGPARC